MPTGYLTRIVEFTATHRFPDTPLFAGATHDHSHHYQCAVTIKGSFDPARGGVWSLPDFKALLQREIVAPLDGRHINRDIPAFADGKLVPTGEALAVYLWARVAAGLPAGVTLDRIRVQEGPHLYAEYDGAS
jgi:6-pyruvoyltetrahydropterin/6-carboxytetrahydropterin synthase